MRKKKKKVDECDGAPVVNQVAGGGNAVPFDPETGIGSGDRWDNVLGGKPAVQAHAPNPKRKGNGK